MVKFVFDSYAVIELLKHNPKYEQYNNYPLIITQLNKIEVLWWALLNHGRELVDILLTSLSQVQSISDEVLREALLFRQKHKKRDLSYADCVGYTLAKQEGLLFLTGDQQFEGLDGVRFVK